MKEIHSCWHPYYQSLTENPHIFKLRNEPIASVCVCLLFCRFVKGFLRHLVFCACVLLLLAFSIFANRLTDNTSARWMRLIWIQFTQKLHWTRLRQFVYQPRILLCMDFVAGFLCACGHIDESIFHLLANCLWNNTSNLFFLLLLLRRLRLNVSMVWNCLHRIQFDSMRIGRFFFV